MRAGEKSSISTIGSRPRGVRFVKQVHFKPEVKERGSNGRADGESEEEEVMCEGMGESDESETEELVPE